MGGRSMVVYLDLIFALNLLIDASTLHVTAWSRKLRAKRWRIWAAAAIGASYVMMMFFPALSVFFTFIIKILFSFAMIVTAFGFGSLQYFLRNVGVFYFVNFVAAGCILGLHYILQSQGEVMSGVLYSRSGGITFQFQLGLVFLIAAFFISVLIYKAVLKSLHRKEQ